MSTQLLVERIISDAQLEAQTIIAEAENKAAKLLAEASLRAETLRKQTEKEAAEKRIAILEKRAADARLDGAKLLLAEKRKVIDALYDEALSRLLELSKEDCLRLVDNLLRSYAEEGDVVCFADNFRYASDVKRLPVAKEKKLLFEEKTLPLDGGLYLKGKLSDKDLSFGALLAVDREENQAALAKSIFK